MGGNNECSDKTLRNMLVEYFDELLKARSTEQSRDYLFEKSLHTASFHLNEKIRLDSAHILSYLCYFAKVNISKKSYHEELEVNLSSFNEKLKGLSDKDLDPLFKVEIDSFKLVCKEKMFPKCFRADKNHEFATELFMELSAFVSNHPKARCMLEDVMINMLNKLEKKDPKILLEVVFYIFIKSKTPEKQVVYELARQVIMRTAFIFDSYLNEFVDKVVRVKASRLHHFKDHIYDLIYELDSMGKFSSLIEVIHNLENILKKQTKATNVKKEVVELLGKLLSKKNSLYQYELESLYQTFIACFQDKNVDVRDSCINFWPALLTNHPKFKNNLEKQLSACAKNSEVSTRQAVVNAILSITKQNISIIDKPLLKILLKMASEETFQIRKVALVCLCRVFKAWESGYDLSTVLKILNKVLITYHSSEIKDQILVEQCMRYFITPFEMPKEKLVIRICGIFAAINSTAAIAFKTLFSNQNNIRKCLQSIVENVKLPNGENSISIENQIQLLSAYLPESPTALIYLDKFCQLLMNDSVLKKYLQRMLNCDYSRDEIDNIFTDITTKLKGSEQAGSELNDDMTKRLLQRSILPIGIFDSKFISLLIERIHSTEIKKVDYFLVKQMDKNYNTAMEVDLLYFIFDLNPVLFNSEKLQKELLLLLYSDNTIIVKLALKIIKFLGRRITERVNKHLMDVSVPRWVELTKSRNEKQLKHAMECLAHLSYDRRKNEFSKLLNETLIADNRKPTERLILIGYIAFFNPRLFEESASFKFGDFCSKFYDVSLLLNESTREEIENEEAKTKVEFMKCVVRCFIGFSKAQKCVDLKHFEAFITFLTDFFSASSIEKFNFISEVNYNLLKVTAASSVLKLATEPSYPDCISNKSFLDLSTLIEGDYLRAKEKFAYKLDILLMSLKLPIEYITLLIMGVFDDDRNLSNSVKKYIIVNMNNRIKAGEKNGLDASNQSQCFNNLLPYAIYLLAHHPTFTHYKQFKILDKFKICLWLLLEPIMKVANCDFFNKQLRRLMQAEIIVPEPTEVVPNDPKPTYELHNKVCVLCDICLRMLKTKAKYSSVVIEDSSEDIDPTLPAKLFKSSENLIYRDRNFLPSNFSIKIPKEYNTYKAATTEVETSSEEEEEESKNLFERSRSEVETSSEEDVSNHRSTLAVRKRSSSRASMTVPASKRSRGTAKDNTI